jgi:hypothetical protein
LVTTFNSKRELVYEPKGDPGLRKKKKKDDNEEKGEKEKGEKEKGEKSKKT